MYYAKIIFLIIILDIGDVNEDGEYNVKDFLELMKNKEELEKKTGIKKFDICLMNPPYGSNNDTFHLKFVDKVLDIADKQITIMPFTFVIQPENNRTKKYKEKFSEHLVNVEQLSTNAFKDVTSLFDFGIYKFEKKSEKITINFKNGEIKTVNKLNEIDKFNDYEKSFIKYLNNNGDIDGCWAGGHDHCTVTSLARKGITNEKEVWRLINKEIENSCKNLKEGKHYLLLSENGYGQNGVFFENNTGQIFNDRNKLIEFLQEHGKKTTRGYLFLMFNSEKAAKNCKNALLRPLMRFGLYRTQYARLIRMRHNYKYIPNIDWEDPRCLTDEGILEICGCPKNKCKEYAEYCKHIIDELDKGNRL